MGQTVQEIEWLSRANSLIKFLEGITLSADPARFTPRDAAHVVARWAKQLAILYSKEQVEGASGEALTDEQWETLLDKGPEVIMDGVLDDLLKHNFDDIAEAVGIKLENAD